MITIPEKLDIANLPTKIEKLERLSKLLNGPNIYIKRDDQTGTEVSGNKIRKLEFSVKEALDKKCDTLITCGGIQSNHCRATAAVASKLGLKSYLILRGSKETKYDGNLFINKLLGSEIIYISAEDYKFRRLEIMENLKNNLESKGLKPYIIPEGASNGIGSFGYYNTMKEIIEQENALGIKFNNIVLSVGSGGTHAGLILAKKIFNHHSNIYGVNVCDDENYFKSRIIEIINESMSYLNLDIHIDKDEINIIDGYVGQGYAISTKEELNFISKLARLEGIILDPVYTGKGMYGLINEIQKGRFKKDENILFIHTGGLFGLFPQKDLFEL